jgi:hypothetical protein
LRAEDGIILLATMSPSQIAEACIVSNPLLCRRYTANIPELFSWCPKTRQQFRSAAMLLTKLLRHRTMTELSHADLVDFVVTLARMPRSHHLSPADDVRSLEEIINLAHETSGADYRSLSNATIERHLNNVRLAHAWLGQHIAVNSIDWASLIRTVRGVPTKMVGLSVEQVRSVFRLPTWTGCKRHFGTPTVGQHVWHGSSYWVPIGCWYTGLGRDVFCGLGVDDLVTIDGRYCLEMRRERHPRQRDRNVNRDVPLHDEMIRLGFVDFVAAVRESGQTKLFPELVRASGESASDIYNSRYWRPLRELLVGFPASSGPGAISTGARRALEEQDVTKELLDDLFGIRPKDVITENYMLPAPAARLAPVVDRIPNVTAHLVRSEVRLLPVDVRTRSKARCAPRRAIISRQDRELEEALRRVGSAEGE